MKKYIVLLLVAVSFPTALFAQNVKEQTKGMDISVAEFEYRADSVFLSLDIDVNDIDISSTESLFLTPRMFKSEDNMLELPTVVLRGRSGAKSYKRAVTLDNRKRLEDYAKLYRTPYAEIDCYGKELREIKAEGGIVNYQYALPYETWMVESVVSLGCDSYGCTKSKFEGVIIPESTENATNVLGIDLQSVDAYNVIPKVSLIKPEKVAIKRRDIQYSSALVFRVNSSVIEPSLAQNQKELNSIDSMMLSVVSDDDYTITEVNISGFASPEGTLESNQRLSERRALALEKILKQKYSIPHNLYNVTFGGENWDGLIPMIEASDMAEKDEVLDIIKNVPIVKGRESKIMNLAGGRPYRYMLKNYFPKVRLVVVDVQYNVDAYDIVRIREVIDEKPENLSLEEIYRLSETYDVNSDEFLDLFLKAVSVYPNDEVALNNAMVADITKGDVEAARQYAEKASHSTDAPEMLNTLGAYYMLSGDYPKAKGLLDRAAGLGSQNAEYNLEQLELKLDNIAQMEESEALRKKIYGEL